MNQTQRKILFERFQKKAERIKQIDHFLKKLPKGEYKLRKLYEEEKREINNYFDSLRTR